MIEGSCVCSSTLFRMVCTSAILCVASQIQLTVLGFLTSFDGSSIPDVDCPRLR
jgi:hypothetical protein